jgi:hypothetical protein
MPSKWFQQNLSVTPMTAAVAMAMGELLLRGGSQNLRMLQRSQQQNISHPPTHVQSFGSFFQHRNRSVFLFVAMAS